MFWSRSILGVKVEFFARINPNGEPFRLFSKRLGLSNFLSENHPSLSRQFELFPMPTVAHGFNHFMFGDCQALR
jgi:hypothetical protein